MRKLILYFFFSLVTFIQCFGQHATRNSLFSKRVRVAGNGQDVRSLLTIGTMAGLSWALDKPMTYKIVDRIIQVDTEDTRLLPAVYAVPSINLWGTPGKSLSAILPINLNPSQDLALGFGLTFGFNVRSSGGKDVAEIGFSIMGVWSDRQFLSEAQKTSLNSKTPLSQNEPLEIKTRNSPSLGIGFFICPLL